MSNSKGFRYIFVLTDNDSKDTWCFPLNIKSDQAITDGYSIFLTTSKRKHNELTEAKGFEILFFKVF